MKKGKLFEVPDMPSVQNITECLISMQQIRNDMEKLSGEKFNDSSEVVQAVRKLIMGYKKMCLMSQI